MRAYEVRKPFEGVITNLERRYKETESEWSREEIERYMTATPCESCAGFRLKPEALAVKIDGKHIGEVSLLSVKAAIEWARELPQKLDAKRNEIAHRILKEIVDRLTFLSDVGLDYLTLSRASGTLSGGESQRIRLASQIGSGLTGVLYVLDEPSIGLHQRDNARLLDTLQAPARARQHRHRRRARRGRDSRRRLCRRHRPRAPACTAARSSPRGRPRRSRPIPNSLTGHYLSGERFVPIPAKRRKAAARPRAEDCRRARQQSERTSPRRFRSGLFTCVTGVSGGGKSTLTIDTLYKAVARHLNGASDPPAPHDRIDGLEQLDKVIDIDQSPIGRTPRSNPATYTGAFTPIREWFAGLPEAKQRGYQPGRFSFNVKGGRCEACQGDGVIKIEMHFLPDVYVTCDVCKGKRYDRETLEVRYRDKSIADVLDMTVEEAADLFKAVPSIREKMETLKQVGLELHQGRPAGDDPVRRRGAAGKARQGAGAPLDRPHPLHPRRADHRPAFPRRRAVARGAARARRPGQHDGGHRA